MRVLVVGGAGYIGSVTVDQLVAAGDEVTVLDSLVSGHRDAVNDDAELAAFDVRSEDQLHQLFAANSFDAVIHYGGYIQAGESVRQPGRYFANNVSGSIALLNAMVAFGVSRFVFSSSAAVYGEPDAVPILEKSTMRPVNPYGETKAVVEHLLPWYEHAHGIHSVSLRYFNAAGATPARGEDHRPETHLIPNVLLAAMGLRPSVTLFGTDYPTPDGTCIRDYVHVGDLAAGHLLAIEKTGTGSAAYNLGTGHGVSNREVIEATRRVTGVDFTVIEDQRRAGDPPVLVASPERAKAELGWSPQHTELDEIIASAWVWHQANPQGYTG